MRDDNIFQSKEFLETVDKFTPTTQDLGEACLETGILWGITAALFFILQLGHAFPVRLQSGEISTITALVFLVAIYGIWVMKNASTREEWKQGIYLTAFPATFSLAILAAGI